MKLFVNTTTRSLQMLDKATVLTTLFTIVDDIMKGSAVIQKILKPPGASPQPFG